MSNIGRWVVWGLLPSLIAGVLLNATIPFNSINSEVFAVILTDPILRTGASTFLLVAPVYFGISYLTDLASSLVERRQEIQKSNSPSIASTTQKPSKLTWNGVIRKCGVDWYVIVGEPRRGSRTYAYIQKRAVLPAVSNGDASSKQATSPCVETPHLVVSSV